MNDEFDELDRALFALPLEAPPPGMRDTILRATVYAGASSPLAFARWEIVCIGAALALGAWLVLFAFANHGLAAAVVAGCFALVRELGSPATLAWLATGVAVVMTATFTSFTLPRFPVRSSRS